MHTFDRTHKIIMKLIYSMHNIVSKVVKKSEKKQYVFTKLKKYVSTKQTEDQ